MSANISVPTTPTTFPAFLDLPFTALRSFAEQSDLGVLVNLMLANKTVDNHFRAQNIRVGGYKVNLNASAGVEVPAKGYKFLWEGASEQVVDKTIYVFGELFSRFPGYVDTVSVDMRFAKELLEYSSFGECCRLEISSDLGAFDSQEHIDALMDSLHIRDSFRMNVPNCRVNIEKIVHLENVELRGPSYWFTAADLLRFDAKDLYIGWTSMTETDINAFLVQWRDAKEAKKLDSLCLEHNVTYNNWKLHKILSGIPTQPFDSKRPTAIFPATGWAVGIDMSEGIDIQRDDGLVATVKLTESMLHVVVWKDTIAVEEERLKRKLESIEQEIAREQIEIDRNDCWMHKNWMAGEKPTAKRQKTELDEAMLEENKRIRKRIVEMQMEMDVLKKKKK